CVPSQRSAVSQRVPRTVADAKRPFVRKRPLPLAQSWRTVVFAACGTLDRRRGQTAKLPFASRSSTIGRARSVPRTSTKAAVTPLAPVTVSVRVSVRSTTVPRVTSTVALYGTWPVVNGRPFTVTVPVVVAVAGGAAPPDGVVVVVVPPPPPG